MDQEQFEPVSTGSGTGPPTEERKKAAAIKRIHIAFLVTLCFFVALLIVSIVQVARYYAYHHEKTVAVRGGEPFTIALSPESNATKASAQYLAYRLEQAAGIQTEIVFEDEASSLAVRIVCGAELPESGQKANILFPAAEAASEDEKTAYTIYPEKNGFTIVVPEQENCFGAVKAITDRWLQEDCGLRHLDTLTISGAMIDEQLSSLPTEVSGTIRILSQNLCFSDDPGGNSVEERAVRFFRLVQEYHPDLIGTQECSPQWLQLLRQNLGEQYEIYGESRTGKGATDGEWDAILYKKERFSFEDGETFWLSNTPGEASKLEYYGPNRICTWAQLHDREAEKSLLFSNTHLQNSGSEWEVRERQAEILLRRLRKGNLLSQYPGFLTGDFNGETDEAYYSQISMYYEDARNTAITDRSNIDYSFHHYGASQRLLDYCFHSPEHVAVLDYQVLDKAYGGYVSDHYGILVNAFIY